MWTIAVFERPKLGLEEWHLCPVSTIESLKKVLTWTLDKWTEFNVNLYQNRWSVVSSKWYKPVTMWSQNEFKNRFFMTRLRKLIDVTKNYSFNVWDIFLYCTRYSSWKSFSLVDHDTELYSSPSWEFLISLDRRNDYI